MKTQASWAVGLLGLMAIVAVLWPRQAATPEEREALAQGRVIVIYWDRHSGHEHEARRVLINEFNRSQDRVYVRPLSIGYNASMEKLLTSIAGNAPPDICALESTIMAQLVGQGCITPVEDRLAALPNARQEDFFPHCWGSVAFEGHVWGVPTTTDTYCLLWNKNAFRRAGLDPERPPQTLDELQEYAAKLTIYDNGALQQIGFLPWLPWDMTGMWGLQFGGQWYDTQTGRATCGGDPHILSMFEWQKSFALDPRSPHNAPYAIDPERIHSFSAGFGAYMSANNPFYSGKIAMVAEGEWQVTFVPKYAPELDWGVAPLPTIPGAPPRAYGGPCVVDCIPRGCRNPDAAWEYFKWFYSPRPNGGASPASDYNYAIHNICTRPAEATQERFIRDPKFRVFVNVLLTHEVVSVPTTPTTQFMLDEADRHRELVVFRKETSEQALQEVETTVNKEIEQMRRARERTPA